MRSRSLPLAVLALAAWLTPTPLSAAGSTAEEGMTPEEKAEEAFHRAVRYRDEAAELEAEAATLEGAAAEKKLEKAAKAHERAARSLRAAIGHDPSMHQAHSDLGFALRKLGDYEGALASYDRALELSPGYPEAIEYRAEAYLGLGRLEDAKAAYMELLRTDRPSADELMTAMKRWVEQRRADAKGLDAAAVEDFALWVEERERAAAQTADLGAVASGW